MLYAFAFDRIGVVVSDVYVPSREGPERGVRLEIRVFERGELPGSIFSARPIAVTRPIWRADLLESPANPGTLDRAHYHPRFRGWEPARRHFVEEMSADPVAWVGKRLSDLDGLLEQAEFSWDEVGPSDAGDLRAAVSEIVDVVRRLLDRVRGGELAVPPDGLRSHDARVGWL